MAPKKPLITDVEFEVIEGPYRVGDEHRTRKRWLWTGLYRGDGVPLWYRPPRFTQYQFAAVVVGCAVLGMALLLLGLWVWTTYFGDPAPAAALAAPAPVD